MCLWNSWLSFLYFVFSLSFFFLFFYQTKINKNGLLFLFFPPHSSFPSEPAVALNRCAQVATLHIASSRMRTCVCMREKERRSGNVTETLFSLSRSDTDISHDGRDIVGPFDLPPSFVLFVCGRLCVWGLKFLISFPPFFLVGCPSRFVNEDAVRHS